MRKYSGKFILILWISICILAGCGAKDVLGQAVTESIEAVTTECQIMEQQIIEPETTPVVKPISEYKDCREVVPDTYVPEGDYEIQEHGVYGCLSVWYDNISQLCGIFRAHPNKSIVVGEVVGDICYSGSWSEIPPSQPYGYTYYTFAVTEVLYGSKVEAETLITVKEEQGYVKSPDKENLWGYSHWIGNPAVQVGDKYVLFLEAPEVAPDGEGYIYDGVWFMNKYFLCDDGMYRRHSIEAVGFGEVDPVTGLWIEEEFTYEELKERILGEMNGLVGKEPATISDENSEKTVETYISITPVDLEGDGAKEQLEVVALGDVDAGNQAAVRQFLLEGGEIVVRLRQDNGELLREYCEYYLGGAYQNYYQGQFFLVNIDGRDRILRTDTSEDRWSGSMGAEIMTIYSTRGNDFKSFGRDKKYEGFYKSFIKMRRNPMDLPEETRSAHVDDYKAFLEPYLEDSVLLIAVDVECDWLVKFSTEDKKLSGTEYFDEYWQREETYVDDGRFYK